MEGFMVWDSVHDLWFWWNGKRYSHWWNSEIQEWIIM